MAVVVPELLLDGYVVAALLPPPYKYVTNGDRADPRSVSARHPSLSSTSLLLLSAYVETSCSALTECSSEARQWRRRSPGGVRLRQDDRRLRQRQLGRRRARCHRPVRRAPAPPSLERRHRCNGGRAALGGQDGRRHQSFPKNSAAFPSRRRGHQIRLCSRVRAADPERRQRLLHRHHPRAQRPRRLLLRHRHQPGPRRRRWPPQDLPAPRVPRPRRRPRLRPPHLPAQHVQGQGDGEDAPARRSLGGGRGEEAEEGRGVSRRRQGRLLPVPEAVRGGLRDAADRVRRVRPHCRLAAGRRARRRPRVGRLRGPRQGSHRHRRQRDCPRRDGRCRRRRRHRGRGHRARVPRRPAADAAGGAGASGGAAAPQGRPRAQLIRWNGWRRVK